MKVEFKKGFFHSFVTKDFMLGTFLHVWLFFTFGYHSEIVSSCLFGLWSFYQYLCTNMGLYKTACMYHSRFFHYRSWFIYMVRKVRKYFRLLSLMCFESVFKLWLHWFRCATMNKRSVKWVDQPFIQKIYLEKFYLSG